MDVAFILRFAHISQEEKVEIFSVNLEEANFDFGRCNYFFMSILLLQLYLKFQNVENSIQNKLSKKLQQKNKNKIIS